MTGVELLVVGWFASPVIKSVVDKAQKYVGGNYKLQKEAQGMVDTLIGKLVLCQKTVKVAEEMMINDPDLTTWLMKLKDAAYDADDVLDKVEAKSIKEQVQGGKSENKVSKFASSILKVVVADADLRKLKEVLDRLEKISDDIPKFADLIKLNENARSNNHEQRDPRETTSQESKSFVGLYGREHELNTILDMILESYVPQVQENFEKKGQNSNGLFVLPIVGIGGVGKTALARAVYNHSQLQGIFEMTAWIYVSHNHDVVMLMRKLIQSFDKPLSSDVVMTLEYISKKLSSVIGGRRFIVVLDNMCKKIEDEWKHLYDTLTHGAPGSVVLITTQNEAFANNIATNSPILLNGLESGIFWELFESIAFGNVEIDWKEISELEVIRRRNLEVIGRRIASKLDGLPLAAEIIGKLLRKNIHDLDEWKKISKSEWWNIPEGKSKIVPSLGVGYQHLNPYLRQCFAYCSLFPKNLLIDKDRLVQMWIAQNFIPRDSTGEEKMEDVGRKWFQELVEKSFFQTAVDYEGYVIPSLMHDLVVAVFSECFYFTDQSHKIPQGVRHLAVDINNPNFLVHIPKPNQIRSFLYFGLCNKDGMCSAINEILSNLDSIRVLDLSYLHMETKNPPPAIQNMSHLRFLDLSYTGIEELTKLDFYHLQALHIRQFQCLVTLPRDITKLINLRHLNADPNTIAKIPHIGQLINLQELDEYRVGKSEGYNITELHNMREIRGHLRVINCENIKNQQEVVQARLADKQNLRSVELCWSFPERNSNKDKEILEGLKPHEDTNQLTIEGYMGPSFPNWMSELSHFLNLQTIRLISCINTEDLPPLGQLTFLSTLEIVDNKALRKAPFHHFPESLKVLKIVGCPNLKLLAKSFFYLGSLSLLHVSDYRMSISIKIYALWLLEDLTLRDCPKLSIEEDRELPTNLKRLEITNCPQLLSNSTNDITSRQKGNGIRVHWSRCLWSLSYLEFDQSLLNYNNCYHLMLGMLPSLRFLNCRNLKDCRLELEELPILQELSFRDCEFEAFPYCLSKLSTLKKLKIVSCANLKWFSWDDMPPLLQYLTLEKCSPQFVTCCWLYFPEQHRSHFPLLRIDGRRIARPQTSRSDKLCIGGWFASAVISRVVEQAQYLGNGICELATLIHTLLCCKETVEIAEKIVRKPNLVVWLRMLKGALYDAEDVLDNIEDESIEEKNRGKNKVSKYASSSLELVISDDNHKRLKNVLDRLKEISHKIKEFDYLVEGQITISHEIKKCDDHYELHKSRGQRETNSRPLEKVELYGTKEQFNQILEMILESGSSKKKEQNYNNYQGVLVIPIVGMGGVGKTALAQAVYNHPDVQGEGTSNPKTFKFWSKKQRTSKKFEFSAWISISHNLDVKLVMKELIKSLLFKKKKELIKSFGGRQNVKMSDDISKNLSSIIDGKRFLVVLDDISEKIENQWDNLYNTLKPGAPGSVILITTQNQAFADRVKTFCPIVLNPLEQEQFWELLAHFAPCNIDNSHYIRDIIRRWQRLPFEAEIFGKFLSTPNAQWWEIVEGTSQILPSIRLAYLGLNPFLRQCFAYCSLFPRNSLIDEDTLVKMWIAQNFIPHDDTDIGREWFQNLVDMGFLQFAGDYKGYVMPSLMHDLAIVVSSDECFYLTDQSWGIPPSVRHLAVNTKNLDVLKEIPKENHIRSFLYFGSPHVEGMYSTIIEVLSNLDSLRVLDLSYLLCESKERPRAAIPIMPHVRFLNPSFLQNKKANTL